MIDRVLAVIDRVTAVVWHTLLLVVEYRNSAGRGDSVLYSFTQFNIPKSEEE